MIDPIKIATVVAWSVCLLSPTALGSALPDPDGQPADMSKPVQVYILLGQSNMIGYGKVARGVAGYVDASSEGYLDYAISSKGNYPYLVDGTGAWTERSDVRYIRVQGSALGNRTLYANQWLKVIDGVNVGVEHGIGHHLGHALDAPVMLLKSCIGNRALGWDLLPPGGVSYEHTEPPDSQGVIKTWVYPGFGGSPERWEKGATPSPIGWTAGVQYAGDVFRSHQVLNDLSTYYPGATRYVVAGFFWWQGFRDLKYEGHAIRYEQNLVRLIEQLRLEFNAPHAKFVCATLGETAIGATGNQKLVFDAQMAINDAATYPQFAGDVATVYSHPLSMGSSSGSHYGGHAETYMNVGEAMGQAMVGLIAADPVDLSNWLDGYPLVDTSFSGDDDNDHLPNGIEALFGTSPDVGNTGITLVGKAGSTVTFTHPNPDAADLLLDVTGSYEWSPDLQNWYQADGLDGPGGITVTTNATADSPSARVTTVVATITGGDSAELYLRAVATQN